MRTISPNGIVGLVVLNGPFHPFGNDHSLAVVALDALPVVAAKSDNVRDGIGTQPWLRLMIRMAG